MRNTMVGLLIMAGAMLMISHRAEAQAQFGLSIQNGQVESFYLSIGEYFGAPQRQMSYLRGCGLQDDEVPVVLFIARHSRRSPEEIVSMRQRGESWMDISTACGVSLDYYGAPTVVQSGPPYGNAYGYYKKHPRAVRYSFTDDQIITAVNVHFLGAHYRYSEPEIRRWRSNGESFYSISDDLRTHRHHERDADEGNGRGRGRGHGRHGDD